MSGEAFEFTPGGIQPLAPPVPTAGTISAAVAVAALREQVADKELREAQERKAARGPSARETSHELGAKAALSAPLNRRSFVSELRARLAQVRRELKAKRRLEAEEAELVRLIAAAKQPPARVTPITSARKSG